jgi:hypothetical protein
MNKKLMAKIDKAHFDNKITTEEAKHLHQCRVNKSPLCLGKYDFRVPNCLKQDTKICKLCKIISNTKEEV